MGRKLIKNPPRFIPIRITEKSHEYLINDCKDPIFKTKPLHEILHRVLMEHAEVKDLKFVIDDLKTTLTDLRKQKEGYIKHIDKLETDIQKLMNKNNKEEVIVTNG